MRLTRPKSAVGAMKRESVDGKDSRKPRAVDDVSIRPEAAASSMSLKQTLDSLLKPTKDVHIPPAPPFPYKLNEAHRWSIPQVLKYLDEVMELSQYDDNFRRAEITGHAFICLSSFSKESTNASIRSTSASKDRDNLPVALKDVKHELHRAKILANASKLRKCVFEDVITKLPKNFLDWSPEHVASYLTIREDCPFAGVLTLTGKLSGLDLGKMNRENILRVFDHPGCSPDEKENSLKALMKLIPNFDADESRPADSSKKNDSNKRETAMKKRKVSNKYDIPSKNGELSSSRSLAPLDESRDDDPVDEPELEIPSYEESLKHSTKVLVKPIKPDIDEEQVTPKESSNSRKKGKESTEPAVAEFDEKRLKFLTELSNLQKTVLNQSKSLEKLQHAVVMLDQSQTISVPSKSHQQVLLTTH